MRLVFPDPCCSIWEFSPKTILQVLSFWIERHIKENNFRVCDCSFQVYPVCLKSKRFSEFINLTRGQNIVEMILMVYSIPPSKWKRCLRSNKYFQPPCPSSKIIKSKAYIYLYLKEHSYFNFFKGKTKIPVLENVTEWDLISVIQWSW